MRTTKWLGGCTAYKERIGKDYECCDNCHREQFEENATPIWREFPDGYYACCCTAPEAKEVPCHGQG